MLDASFKMPDTRSRYRFALTFYIKANIIISNLKPESFVCLKWKVIFRIAI